MPMGQRILRSAKDKRKISPRRRPRAGLQVDSDSLPLLAITPDLPGAAVPDRQNRPRYPAVASTASATQTPPAHRKCLWKKPECPNEKTRRSVEIFYANRLTDYLRFTEACATISGS